MVTPISDMLRLWTIDSGEEKKESGTDRDLIPLATPLMASGYTPSGMEFLTDKMKDFNMVPYSAASAGVDEMPRPLRWHSKSRFAPSQWFFDNFWVLLFVRYTPKTPVPLMSDRIPRLKFFFSLPSVPFKNPR